MSHERLVGARLARDGPVLWLEAISEVVSPGEVVTVELNDAPGVMKLATIIVTREQLLANEVTLSPLGRILGRATDDEIEKLGRAAPQARAAVEMARLLCEQLAIESGEIRARLAPDQAQLWIEIERPPSDVASFVTAMVERIGLPVTLVATGGSVLSGAAAILPQAWEAWMTPPGGEPVLLDRRAEGNADLAAELVRRFVAPPRKRAQ